MIALREGPVFMAEFFETPGAERPKFASELKLKYPPESEGRFFEEGRVSMPAPKGWS